jgi:hypothetical protein
MLSIFECVIAIKVCVFNDLFKGAHLRTQRVSIFGISIFKSPLRDATLISRWSCRRR